MSDLNVTSTIVSFSNAPHMLENGWKFIAISSSTLDSRVLLVKGGYQELASNGKQRRMRPKRGAIIDIIAPQLAQQAQTELQQTALQPTKLSRAKKSKKKK